MEIVTKEIWKTVIVNGEVYNNYMVSNLGNIKSLNYRHTGKEKMLKPLKHKDNYLMVVLYKNRKRKNYKVHRLVAEVFIPKIEGKEFVDHIDGNRQNNNVENLRWCNQAENNNFDLYRKHMSEAKKGEKHPMYGKTGELNHRSKIVICIELNKIFGSTYEAERETGINHSSISRCCRGKLKSSGKLNGIKLHWKYTE